MVKSSHPLAAYLRSLVAPQEGGDVELLQRFIETRDGDAFAALLRRHGPMVLGLARRACGEEVAEDVFQATFLLLSRKAHTIRRPESLSCWLHAVAHRLAVQARRSHLRRRQQEAKARPSSPLNPLDELTSQELLTVLDDELGKLPEKQRAPLILCCLEGLSQEEAAKRLGCSADAVRGRLERGRQRLRLRLEKRGLTLPAVFGGTLLLAGSTRAVPLALTQSTLQAATTGVGTTPVAAALIQEAMRRMLFTKLKLVCAAVAMIAATGTGVSMMTFRPQVATEKTPTASAAIGDKPLSPEKRVDLHGDPLPDGVRMRLGTIRRRAVRAQLAASADGKSILGVCGDKYIRVWDAATGELRQERKLSPAPSVSHLALLSADGRLLIAPVEQLSRLAVWDTATGKKIRTLALEGRFLLPRALSLDGKLVAIEDKTALQMKIRVWDLAKNKERFAQSPQWWMEGLTAFSPDGKYLLAADMGQDEMFCWDAATGQERWHNTKLGVGYAKFPPAFTVDGTKAIFTSNSADGLVAIDLATGKAVSSKNLPRIGSIDRLTLSPDGLTLLVSTPKGVRVWDVKEGKERRLLAEAGEQVVFLPDGKSIVSNNGSLQRWDVATGKPLWPDTFAWGHADRVGTLAFSKDGKRLVSGSDDGTVRLWDTTTGKPLHTWRAHQAARVFPFGGGTMGGVTAAALGGDGRWILSGGLDEPLSLWDAQTGKFARSLPLPPRQHQEGSRSVSQVRISSDATKGVALFLPHTGYGADGTPRYRLQMATWNLSKGELIGCHTVASTQDRVFSLSEDGRTAALTRELWDTASGKRKARLIEDKKDEQPSHNVFSRDGALVASRLGWPMKGIRVWETATGKPIALVGGSEHEVGVFHPDGRFLALRHNSDIVLWDIRENRQVHRWKMPESPDSLAFSPDGRRLAAAMPDGTILLHEKLKRDR